MNNLNSVTHINQYSENSPAIRKKDSGEIIDILDMFHLGKININDFSKHLSKDTRKKIIRYISSLENNAKEIRNQRNEIFNAQIYNFPEKKNKLLQIKIISINHEKNFLI
ncbi:MAG: hypothetical protein GY828_03190 [Candidatus Gracilibacteria bacterium]|nr:hypothetical protein [Candidatus Gracilibacteria bacterium]